jgi:hypothetical protein
MSSHGRGKKQGDGNSSKSAVADDPIIEPVKKGTKRKIVAGNVECTESNAAAAADDDVVSPEEDIRTTANKRAKAKPKVKKYKYAATLTKTMVYIEDPRDRAKDVTNVGRFRSEEDALEALLEEIISESEAFIDGVLLTLWDNEKEKERYAHLLDASGSRYPELCDYFMEKFLSVYEADTDGSAISILAEVEDLFNNEDIDMADEDYKPFFTLQITKCEV